MKNRHTRHLLLVIILFVFFLPWKQGIAQSATSALSINGTGYEVEVELDNSVYKVKLTKGDDSKTEKTNYLTINSFRNIVFDIHLQNLIESGSPGITPAIRNASEPSISSAFLQLITELYNTEALGQKIGEITLNEDALIYGLGQDFLENGVAANATQRLRPKWRSRQENKQKVRLVRRIRRLGKREFKGRIKPHQKRQLDSLNTVLTSREKKKELRDSSYSKSVISSKKEQSKDKLMIESARLVFEDGAIRQITVKGEHNDSIKIFSNKFSIGASTRKNIQDFSRISLYQETHAKPRNQSITLSDVISYERLVNLKTNDFSPADVTVELIPDKKQDLFKASSAQLFSLNIFSDLVGFSSDNPNGLVQLEFSKRINLWTRRTDAWLMNYMGIGWFTHMTPRFELAKIEENNRSIQLSTYQVNDTTTHNYLNPLELHRFSYARITDEINVLDLQAPSVSLLANFFGGVAVTQVQDTIIVNNVIEDTFDEPLNSLILGVNMRAIFNPESRWSFELSSRWTYFDPLNSGFTYRSIENGTPRGPNYLLNNWELLFTWNTGDDKTANSNKLFGRFRFNHEWKYWNNNYSEFQIGYSIFLKSNKPNKGK